VCVVGENNGIYMYNYSSLDGWTKITDMDGYVGFKAVAVGNKNSI